MTRPAQRPFVRLPTLETRHGELETCTFCPKLCRTKCPVSNAEPRETLIPWGKMTGAYQLALGDLPLARENAAPSWACTGCLACREACDHKNPVATTLLASRAALMAAGASPEAATAVATKHETRTREAIDAAARLTPTESKGAARLLVGCTFLRKVPDAAEDALAVATSVTGGEVSVHRGCCGLPQLLAGDRPGYERSLAAFDASVSSASRLLVADAGCAYALTHLREEVGLKGRGPKPELLVDLVAAHVDRFDAGGVALEDALFHDTCALGRGLGRYDAPRRALRHAVGRAPNEFLHSCENALCSGGGGLLPVTMPEISAKIADARISPAEAPSSGPIVTTCASSLLAFRRTGKVAYDLMGVMRRALRK